MTARRLEIAVAVLAVVLGLTTAALRWRAAHAEHATDFVSYVPGGLPVVLVVPHDGEQWRASVPPRSVTPRRDVHTAAFAGELADALEARTGRRPHVVILHMDRRQVDVNRVPAQAYEHPEAAEVYDAFHARVGQVTAALMQEHGRALLLDIHGNWEFPADLYLGTGGGRTVVAGDGPSIEDQARAAVAAAGFDVATPEETPATLDGDLITGRYALALGGAVQTVMVEVHSRVRDDPNERARLADAMADAVAATFVGWRP
ncbi:MAG: hypothetical protein AAF721_11205 [Myxococcota bacterium]